MRIDTMVRRATYEATTWRNCPSDKMESVCLFYYAVKNVVNAMSPCSNCH